MSLGGVGFTADFLGSFGMDVFLATYRTKKRVKEDRNNEALSSVWIPASSSLSSYTTYRSSQHEPALSKGFGLRSMIVERVRASEVLQHRVQISAHLRNLIDFDLLRNTWTETAGWIKLRFLPIR